MLGKPHGVHGEIALRLFNLRGDAPLERRRRSCSSATGARDAAHGHALRARRRRLLVTLAGVDIARGGGGADPQRGARRARGAAGARRPASTSSRTSSAAR